MSEFVRKISMWRLALEERNANLGVMQVFDSMLVFMGEQQREIEELKSSAHTVINAKDVIIRRSDEKVAKIRELINDERITKSETVDKISKIVNE